MPKKVTNTMELAAVQAAVAMTQHQIQQLQQQAQPHSSNNHQSQVHFSYQPKRRQGVIDR